MLLSLSKLSLSEIMNHKPSFVVNWFKANKLTFDPDKPNLFYFILQEIKSTLKIFLSIKRDEYTKLLGVIWSMKSIGIITKCRQFFLINTLHTLYNSSVLPYLQYYSIIWASTYSSHLQPLLLFKKNASRITYTFSTTCAHSVVL